MRITLYLKRVKIFCCLCFWFLYWKLKAKEKAIVVIDKFELAEAKTKSMVEVLKAVKAGKKVLIVLDEENENIINAAKNIAGTMIVPTDNVCVYDLLNVDTVVTTKTAIKKIEEALN